MNELRLSDDGVQFIAQWEGFRAHPYRDVVGKLTIGYGHLMRKGETFPQPMTDAQALALLKTDAEREAIPVRDALRVKLTPHQMDALISLAFNVGGGAVARSTLVRKLNEGQTLEAAEQFLRWNRAGGRIVRGLTRRRVAERAMFLHGAS